VRGSSEQFPGEVLLRLRRYELHCDGSVLISSVHATSPSAKLDASLVSTLKCQRQFIDKKEENGRGARIRTADLLRPRQARYLAALRPDIG
jgi:hypothetical protein